MNKKQPPTRNMANDLLTPPGGYAEDTLTPPGGLSSEPDNLTPPGGLVDSPTKAVLSETILKAVGVPDEKTSQRLLSLPPEVWDFVNGRVERSMGEIQAGQSQEFKTRGDSEPYSAVKKFDEKVKRSAYKMGDFVTRKMAEKGTPPWIASSAGSLIASAPQRIENLSSFIAESAVPGEKFSSLKSSLKGIGKLSEADLETASKIGDRIVNSKYAIETELLGKRMEQAKPLLLSGPIRGEGFEARPFPKSAPKPVSPLVREGEVVAPGNLSEKMRPGESLRDFAERNNLGSTIQGDTHPRLPKIDPKSSNYHGMEWQPTNPIEPLRVKAIQSTAEVAGWNDPQPVKSSKEALRWWSGREMLAHLDADQMANEIRDFVIDKDRRVLVTLHGQLKRAPSVEELKEAGSSLIKIGEAKKIKGAVEQGKQFLRLADQGLELSEQEKNLLAHTDAYFEGMKNPASKSGAIERFREGYSGPHIYQTVEEANGNFLKRIYRSITKSDREFPGPERIFDPRTKFALERSYDNAFEAIKDGKIPATLDSADLVKIYHSNVGRTIAKQNYKKLLMKSGIVDFEKSPGKIHVPSMDMPAVDPSSQSGATMRKAFAKADDAKKINRVMENQIFDYPLLNAIESINRGTKRAILAFSAFHFKALGTEALGSGINPVTGMSKGLELIDKYPDMVRAAVREGLTLADFKDVGKAFWEGGKDMKGVISKAHAIYNTALWQKYWTGMKIYSVIGWTDHIVKSGVPIEEALPAAVDTVNEIYGGLNYKVLGRSPNMQRLLHLIQLAPDWSESRLRMAGRTLGLGMGELSPAAKKAIQVGMAKYWVRLGAWSTASVLLHSKVPLFPDITKESGMRDYKKFARLILGDPIYFTSKLPTMGQAIRYYYGKHKKGEALQRLLPIPINIKELVSYLMKDL